jgi:expansin (peptidoglycan-binding protein)
MVLQLVFPKLLRPVVCGFKKVAKLQGLSIHHKMRITLIALVLALAFTSALSSVCLSGSGTAMYYDDEGYGACGSWIAGGDDSISFNAPQFDPYTPEGNPNKNSICGQKIIISGPKGSVNGTIRDRCPTCKNGGMVIRSDMFAKLADVSQGEVAITWKFDTCQTL